MNKKIFLISILFLFLIIPNILAFTINENIITYSTNSGSKIKFNNDTDLNKLIVDENKTNLYNINTHNSKFTNINNTKKGIITFYNLTSDNYFEYDNDTTINIENETNKTFELDYNQNITYKLGTIPSINISIINPKNNTEETSNPVLFKINTTNEAECKYNLNKNENKTMNTNDNIIFTDSQNLESDKNYKVYFYCNSTSDSSLKDNATTSFYFREVTGGGGDTDDEDDDYVIEKDLDSFEVFKTINKFYYNDDNFVYIETYDENNNKIDIDNINLTLKEKYNITYDTIRKGEGKYKISFNLEEEFESKKTFGFKFSIVKNDNILEKNIFYTFYPKDLKDKVQDSIDTGKDFFDKYKIFILISIGVILITVLFIIVYKNRNN